MPNVKFTKDNLHEWLCKHEAEFEKKYPGMFVAIVDKKIVAVEKDAISADKVAKTNYPKKATLVIYIPKSKKEVQLLI